jgi:hypothetical protein
MFLREDERSESERKKWSQETDMQEKRHEAIPGSSYTTLSVTDSR